MAHVSESERDEKRRVEKGPDVFTNKTEHTSHCADPEGVMRSARCGVCGCAKCTTPKEKQRQKGREKGGKSKENGVRAVERDAETERRVRRSESARGGRLQSTRATGASVRRVCGEHATTVNRTERRGE